jgi:hypothetical protein
MKKIHWRPIPECPLYWVSSDGRVKSYSRVTPIELSQAIDKEYMKISLWYDDKGHTLRVHRLVALAFCRRRPGMDEVNHEDGDKANNNHWNLKWTDRFGNMQHAHQNGLITYHSNEDHAMAKFSNEQVAEIRSKIGIRPYSETLKIYSISVSQYYRIKNNQSRA